MCGSLVPQIAGEANPADMSAGHPILSDKELDWYGDVDVDGSCIYCPPCLVKANVDGKALFQL